MDSHFWRRPGAGGSDPLAPIILFNKLQTSDPDYPRWAGCAPHNIDLWRLNGTGTLDPVQITNGPLSFQAPVADRTGHRIFFLGLDSRSETQQYDPQRHEFIPTHNFCPLRPGSASPATVSGSQGPT